MSDKHSLIKDAINMATEDYIKPKAKEILNNAVVDGIYMVGDFLSNIAGRVIFGQDFGGQNKRISSNPNKYSDISRKTTTPVVNIGTRNSKELQYVVVEDMVKADKLKADLIDSIVKYGRVRVADLYEQSEKVKPSFSDYRYGWTNPADIHYVRDRNGYWFNLPQPKEIQN